MHSHTHTHSLPHTHAHTGTQIYVDAHMHACAHARAHHTLTDIPEHPSRHDLSAALRSLETSQRWEQLHLCCELHPLPVATGSDVSPAIGAHTADQPQPR